MASLKIGQSQPASFAAIAGFGLSSGLPRRRRWILVCLSSLLIASGSLAQAPDPSAAPMVSAADREPITPIPQPADAEPLKLALGERLFGDKRLSHDGTRACVTCHDTRSNGANTRRHDTASDGSELFFNTLTVFNAALSFRLNWEGTARNLTAQAEASLENSTIMNTTLDEILGRLNGDPEMVREFDEAYGQRPDRANLLDAIAVYERSLLTPDSRFDRWLAGDASALSDEEASGYRLFKSFGCIACHQGANIGGNLFERHGIFRPLASSKPEILRVPSLRNVATTPPYFHDGSAPTLDDAVRKMAAAQLDRNLSDEQAAAIVAFLRTLTGTYRGRAVTAASP